MILKTENGDRATYQIYTQVLDHGQHVTSIIVNMKKTIHKDDFDIDSFVIHARHYHHDEVIIDQNVKINNLYVAKDQSWRQVQSGQYVVLECEPLPTLYWDEKLFTNDPMKLEYSLKYYEGKQWISLQYNGRINRIVDDFIFQTSQSQLNYRLYIPTCDHHKKPLIIWLHGAGEGGKSNETQLTGNRGAIAFVEYQDIFGGAYVIAPQAPDYWMDTFEVDNLILKGHDYTKQVVSLIKEVIFKHDDIDISRVYIGGCSMGGYQTWKTLIAAPELFTAAFPICPAYTPTKEERQTLLSIPIWLTHATTDQTVSVEHSREAYRLLKELGGKVHYTEYQDVTYKGVQYGSHQSWIYVLNNEPVSSEGIPIMNWLASQKKY